MFLEKFCLSGMVLSILYMSPHAIPIVMLFHSEQQFIGFIFMLGSYEMVQLKFGWFYQIAENPC